MIRPAALGLLAMFALCNACSTGFCDASRPWNLTVHVRASNGTQVCDATVEQFDKAGNLVATVTGCWPVGRGTGQFSVRARQGARVSDTQVVDIVENTCGGPPAKTAEITLTLPP